MRRVPRGFLLLGWLGTAGCGADDGNQTAGTDYHQRGYTIVYLTARSETQTSMDDAMIPSRQLTAMYKGQTLLDLQAEGYTFEYAYGNAVSDIDGYEMANIPKDVTFIIGEEAGVDGTVAVPEEGWDVHRAAHIPTVANYCEG